jgi:DNA-binding response OmpR family regulator
MTILLVDDDENDSFLLSRALRKNGFDCTLDHIYEADALFAYLDRASAGSHPLPDLILLAIRMRQTSGIEIRWTL